VDLTFTDEQRLLQDTVRAFVDERILPVAIENDINHRLDMELIEGLAELGILGIVIPEEYGGAGLDYVSEALACEEIERGEAAFRTLISVHVGLNSLSLLRYGTEEQKQRYLVPQARGEKLGCFGLTEPAAGSDVAAMRSTARREGDTYVLNGQKNWISYATVADHQLVFAKTDPAAKHKGISAFVVERAWPGVTTRETEHKLGVWAGSTGELFFENVEVPAENLVGEEGQGFEIAMHSLDQGRFTVAAGACGVIRACLERSVAYANERETFGQPIGKYQFVQDMIADMVLGYETSKLLVLQAAWMKDEGLRNTRETSLAKWHATESAFKAAHQAIQVHGAYGYSAEYGIERYFRNARAPIIYGHDEDPQDDAGRARARQPPPQRPHRRDVADRVLGAGARGALAGRARHDETGRQPTRGARLRAARRRARRRGRRSRR
jgi:glutaryl-CoA dehydrogenase (non-decarboxylating)